MYRIILGLLVVIVSLSGLAHADFRYATPINDIVWEAQRSGVACRLTHKVEGYGQFTFERRSGEELELVVTTLQPVGASTDGSMRAVAPAWRHDATPGEQQAIAIKPGRTPLKSGAGFARATLDVLTTGSNTEFDYADGNQRHVSVVLPAIRFRPAWEIFTACSRDLSPVALASVDAHTVYYDPGDDAPPMHAQTALWQAAEYCRNAPDMKGIRISNSTGILGGANARKRFDARARLIREQLIKAGVNADRILIAPERPHAIATNEWLDLRLFGPEGATRVYFPAGQSRLNDKGTTALDMLVDYMRAQDIEAELRIDGHTDDVGRRRANKQLSQRRAIVVRDYLKARGIDSNRLHTRAFGEKKPAVKSRKSSGRASNRRVEIAFM